MISDTLLTLLSVLEAVALVVVLAIALINVRIRLRKIAALLASLARGVGDVQGHLRLVTPTVPQINAPLRDIVGALPVMCEMAETIADRAGK